MSVPNRNTYGQKHYTQRIKEFYRSIGVEEKEKYPVEENGAFRRAVIDPVKKRKTGKSDNTPKADKTPKPRRTVTRNFDYDNLYKVCRLYRDFVDGREYSYYHHTIIAVLWITPIIISAIGGCYYFGGKTKNTRFGRLIRYCSVNLNTIYIIQWLIIAYSVALSILLGIEKTRSPLIIISGGVTVTAVSIAISFPFVKLKNKN